MYITKADLSILTRSALKDENHKTEVLEVLDRLNHKKEVDNARTWQYIKDKRVTNKNYARTKKQEIKGA